MKIYQYLAKRPITDESIVNHQLQLAIDYQRRLVEIEIRRRKGVETLYVEALPAEHAACAEAEKACEAAVLALRAARSYQAVKCEPGDEDAQQSVKEAKAALSPLREVERAAREAKRLARKALTPTIKDKLKALDIEAYAAKKAAYNDSAFADLVWGTKLAVGEWVERAAKASAKEGTLPKLPAFDGSGQIAVQLQGGLGPSELATDTRFRIEVVSFDEWMARQQVARRARYEAQIAAGVVRAWKPGNGITGNDGKALERPKADSGYTRRSGGGQHAFVHLRIGTEDRSPVWASWPVKISRPLPANGVIKWARAHASKVGTRVEWKIQITVDAPETEKKPVSETLAVNLGWRNLEDGGIRVAYAVGTDGHEEEVRVPPAFLSRLEHVKQLRSIRDKLCDEAHRALSSWMGDRDEDLPPWLTEATRYMANWRGPKQLARLIREWETNRFEGDEGIFHALWMWRNGKTEDGHSVGNHHLRFWESDEREKAYRNRNEIYRQIARGWAKRYSRILVTEMDLRDFAEEPEAEDGRKSDGNKQRSTRTVAGPSILRGEIKNACASAGTEFEEKKGAFTETCAACGVRERFDAKHQLAKTCSACGAKNDQDANHCRALIASGQMMRKDGEALAATEKGARNGESKGTEGRWKRRRSQSSAQVGVKEEVVG